MFAAERKAPGEKKYHKESVGKTRKEEKYSVTFFFIPGNVIKWSLEKVLWHISLKNHKI